ncbi:MAG: UDP-N-acetylmuramoyl-L-alanyl-D-glutamate--2,6-diaminopimelate ligase [Mycobacteriaceae bacterium]
MANRPEGSALFLQQPLRPKNKIRTPLVELINASGAVVSQAGFAGTAAAHLNLTQLVTGVTLRAQDVLPGDIFAALPGSRAHGVGFAEEAVNRGAVAVLTDPAGMQALAAQSFLLQVPVLVHKNPRSVLGELSSIIYGRPSQKMSVIGITGTSGKTTTAYMVERGLLAAGRKPGLIGTVETRINGVQIPSALTTPEAPQLQALFALMLEQGLDSVVMEVSSHALALGRVDGTQFEVAGFTNLSQDHLDFHQNFDEYFLAKSRLFSLDSVVQAKHSVICIDDRWGIKMAKVARGSDPEVIHPVSTVTTREDSIVNSTWSVNKITAAVTGEQDFEIIGPDGVAARVHLPLPGRYNVANCLVAAGLLHCVGVGIAEAIVGFANVQVPGRVQRVDRGQNFLAIVDYAHKPAAIEAVIETLRSQTKGRIAIVLGAGGDRDTTKRSLMGAAAARGADFVVVTDDNPRTESPKLIRAEVLAGALSVAESDRAQVCEQADRALAIAQAVSWARAGDVVLIAGKGHEGGQEIDGVKHPFDDREVLGMALEQRVKGRE